MNSRSLLTAAAMAAFVILAACNSEPEVIGGPADPQAEALKNAAPVQLPPSVANSRVYRCADNSLAWIDFYTDNSANVRLTEDGERVRVTAAAPDGPLTAEGYSVSGNAETIQFKAPGKPEQRCRGNEQRRQ